MQKYSERIILCLYLMKANKLNYSEVVRVAHQEVWVAKCRISLLTSNIFWASSELVNSSSSISFRLELLIVFPLLMLSFDAFLIIVFFLSAVVDSCTSDLNVRTFCVHFFSLWANDSLTISRFSIFSHGIIRTFFKLLRLTLLSRLLSRLSVVDAVCWLHEKFTGSQ